MNYQTTSSKNMNNRKEAMKVMRRISDITSAEFDLDEFDPRQERNGEISCHGNMNAKTSHRETRKAVRQISDITSDFDQDKFNLRQEYDGAVACLRCCESIIKMLQERVASKEKVIASKDELIVSKDTQISAREEQIESLKDKIVQMSIDLASTKMEKDELQNKLKRKEASDASSEAIVTLARYRPKKAHSDSKLKTGGGAREDCLNLRKKPPADVEDPKLLIVNFAHQRNSFVTPEDKRSVQFSPMEEIRFYERPEQAVVRKIFYEKEEYARMRKDRKQAVRDVQMQYISLSAGLHRPGDEVLRSCNLTGIENNLSPEIEWDAARHREECVRAVLEEQARQKDSGGRCDPERIAHLSQIRSAWAVKRAKRVAVYHCDKAPKS